MIAICKREFSALFYNVIGWLFVGVMIALYGLYFFLYNMVYGLPTIAQTLSAVSFIFMIAVPILTMRILSEERRNRTDQLIMTAPVSTWQIVLGKYLALAAAFAIPVCLIAVTPLILSMFGDVKYVSCYVALLGFLLYGLMTLSLGLFISSLTESVVISAVVSFILLFLGFMMSSITGAVFSDGGIVATVLNAYDFIGPMDNLLEGSLNLVSILYYVSLTFLFLFLTVESIEKRRWSVSIKKLSGSVFSVATIAVVIAAVVVVNVLVARMPSSATSIDITEQKYYSITKKTKDFLKDYDEDVTIYVIGTKSEVKDADAYSGQMLKKYKEANKHIKVKYVDVEKNPTFTAKYSDEGLAVGSMVVESAKRYKAIPVSDIYESDFDYTTYSQTTTGYDGEGQVTSALEYVATDELPVVYVLEGHDEMGIGGMFADVLAKANYETRTLNLLKEDAVPEDAAALIINGVQTDFSEDDEAKVLAYLQKGGKVLTAMDFLQVGSLTNYKKLLSDYGVGTVDGVVAELNESYYYQNPFYLLPNVETTDATAGVEGKASVFSPFSVGLTHGQEGEDSAFTYTDLMTTSKKAISKSGYGSPEEMAEETSVASEVKKEAGDPEGPFVVGLQVDGKDGGQLFVLGSSYLLTDASDAMVSYRNSRLFEDICSVMIPADEEQGSVVIPVKKYDDTRLTVNARAANLYGLLFIIAAPLGCLIAGVGIWLKRRRR
ncbi:MAG: Gldg family protein [Lachnospiraceae bacterium]|nr:Gldg family protein [Lachnospiraceae bacterium]